MIPVTESVIIVLDSSRGTFERDVRAFPEMFILAIHRGKARAVRYPITRKVKRKESLVQVIIYQNTSKQTNSLGESKYYLNPEPNVYTEEKNV